MVRALFLAAIVATGFDAAANLDAAHLLGRLEADANGVSVAQLEASGLRIDVAAPVQGALIVAAFAFLIAWTSRLYRNLRPLGVRRLRFTEGWAIGGWFVPFVNLVRPKQILNDIWRGSDPARGDGDDWWGRPVPARPSCVVGRLDRVRPDAVVESAANPTISSRPTKRRRADRR